MARHAEVDRALKDPETYCSSAGVGLSDFRKEKPWRPPSLLLEADPPEHTRARAVVSRVLTPPAVRRLKDDFQRRADELVAGLVARGGFDAVSELAEAFPVAAFPDVVGLPEQGRDNLLPYGAMAFNGVSARATSTSVGRWRAPSRCSGGSRRAASRRRWTRRGLARNCTRAPGNPATPWRRRRCCCAPSSPPGWTPRSSGWATRWPAWPSTPTSSPPCAPTLAGPRGVRGGAAVQLAGADVLPHHDRPVLVDSPEGAVADPRRGQGAAVPRCGQPGPEALGPAGGVRHQPPRRRAPGLRRRPARLRRPDDGPPGG